MSSREQDLDDIKAELRELRAMAAQVLAAAEREGVVWSPASDADLAKLLGGDGK